jgi:hypothetical protein
MTPHRLTLISIDFDRTFTSDVEFWRFFIYQAWRRGHEILCVTGRTDTPYSRKELNAVFGASTRSRLKDIVFCDHAPKRARTLALGYKVDIWIDDLPEGVGATDASVFRKLEDLFPVCETLPVFTPKAVHPVKLWLPPTFEEVLYAQESPQERQESQRPQDQSECAYAI